LREMDLGLGRKQQDDDMGQGPPQKARRMAGVDEDIKRLMTLVAKLSLNSAQGLRVMRSILLRVYLLPTESDYMKAVVDATSTYAKTAKEMRQGMDDKGVPKSEQQQKVLDRLGVPHVHAWNALVGVAMKALKAKADKREKVEGIDDMQKAHDSINDYCKQYQARGWTAIADEVKVVMKEKAYGKENMKLLVNVKDPSPSSDVNDIIHMLIKAWPGCRVLPSVAPPGDMERQIQDWPERNGASSGSA